MELMMWKSLHPFGFICIMSINSNHQNNSKSSEREGDRNSGAASLTLEEDHDTSSTFTSSQRGGQTVIVKSSLQTVSPQRKRLNSKFINSFLKSFSTPIIIITIIIIIIILFRPWEWERMRFSPLSSSFSCLWFILIHFELMFWYYYFDIISLR